MDPLRKAWWTVVLALLAIGVGVRVLGASGELWLDEIWTLNLLAERAPTPFHVFWSVQHDNVHPLYGFYAWFLPDYPHPLLYRAPAIILGAGTIIVAGIIGLRGSRAEALIAIALAALSYPMINYGSEARGYGPMMFFVLLAFWLIDGDLREGVTRRRDWVALALVGAVLFHATAILAVLALGLWFLLEHFRKIGSLQRAIVQAFRYFLPAAILLLSPLAFLVAASLVKGFQFGDLIGPEGFPGRFISNVGTMVKLLWGLPIILPSGVAIAIVAVSTAVVIALLIRSGDRRASLYGIVLFGLPAALFSLSTPGHASGRYYLFALVFLIPIGAHGLAMAWHGGRWGKLTSILLFAMFIAGSTWSNSLFLAHGRGNTRAAVAQIAEGKSRPVVRVGTDHGFRFSTAFNYHGGGLVPGIRFESVPLAQVGKTPPQWLVLHRRREPRLMAASGRDWHPKAHITLAGKLYALAAVYRYWGFSGWEWIVYRHQSAPGVDRGSFIETPDPTD